MAGDIFFTESLVWCTNSSFFIHIMKLAIGRCRPYETPLVRILSEASQIRCLGINLIEDRRLQIALTERVLEAAQDMLQELRADADANPDGIRRVEELIDNAQTHLRELRSANK